ncbi:MAG: hypothetical protein QME51_06195 [Planctomycetota bacterium]|nr:hypothetical protein [Planctomycetota bacterium]MDI6787944.1 hypothetical protein [Planctomycetota bacterium]
MKYFLATLYLIAGIILPFVYINLVHTKITTGEIILLAVLFLFCTTAGLIFLLSRFGETPQQSGKIVPYKQTKKPFYRERSEDALPEKKSSPPPPPKKPQGFSYQKPSPMPPRVNIIDKPDLDELMEEVKNLIKLESWQLSLEKANELIHYYPDSPAADKVRQNLSFLIQKTKGTR